MVIPEKGNGNTERVTPQAQADAAMKNKVPFYEPDLVQIKKFFNFSGGSILYCLSAVFVAYGIVNLMGPLLSTGEAIKKAMPCIFTLHIYELALLGVLIFIVSRKAVDDAISVIFLIALFLVGTSISLGSVADTGITASFWLGLLGIVLALVKLLAMRRFVKMPFGFMSILGLLILMACNYSGPAFLARSITVLKLPEPSRREIWWLIWLVMLIGTGFALVEVIKVKPREKSGGYKIPLLQTPIMVSVFVLIISIASGVHQYAMAYTNGFQRVIGDYTLIVAAGALLILEIMRLSSKPLGIMEVIISCTPLAVIMYAIEEKSVISGGEFGFSLLGYPPVILALSGLSIVCWSLYHKRHAMLSIGVLYGLGVILTYGFSPEHPYDLNIRTCMAAFIIILIIYGIVLRNQYLYAAAILVLCVGLSQWGTFQDLTKSYELTTAGGLGGVAGLSVIILCVILGNKILKVFRVIGAISIASFGFDYLPIVFHWRYAIVIIGTALIALILWLRAKDLIVTSVIWIPVLIKSYIASNQLAYWRAIIVGFLLLVAGTAASLLKIRLKERAETQKSQPHSEQVIT